MTILAINSCLCCDLLTGGITIGLLNICTGFFFLFCGLESLILPENIAIALVTLAVSGCWTYGIFAVSHLSSEMLTKSLYVYVQMF